MLYVVSSYTVSQEFKKSRYFRMSLGLVATVEKNGTRVYNQNDKFSHFYNQLYKTTIYGQGNVGDIRFYVDHYINTDDFVIYTDDFQEFIFKLDKLVIREKGVDFYLGSLLKEIEERYDERVKENELNKAQPKPEGNPNLIFQNPGNVKYEDLKAYLEEKNKSRYL